MLQISRKYNFQPGTKAISQQVDEELDQLVENHNSIATLFDLLSQKFDFLNPANYITSPNGTKFQIGVNDDGSLYSYTYDGVYSDWFNPFSPDGGKWVINIDDDGSLNTVKAN
jgi:hypothetical protein